MASPRRAALVSVFAAAALVALKLSVGLATHSLGLVSEAIHSGTDLVAALLTFFAIGVAGRPADPGHQYGHGKAEHLAALAEASILAAASLLIATRAIQRLAGASGAHVDDDHHPDNGEGPPRRVHGLRMRGGQPHRGPPDDEHARDEQERRLGE